MICPFCQNSIQDGIAFCPQCGKQLTVTPAFPAANLPKKGLGIASMVLGIVSLVFICLSLFVLPVAIVAIVLGFIASNAAKEVGKTNSFATAGLVCAWISVGLNLLFLVFSVSASVLSALF